MRKSGFKTPKVFPSSETSSKPKKPYVWKKGKKTNAWDAERARLKPKFERAGITYCELGYPGCWRNEGLGFAHARKRRNVTPEKLGVVILACSANCHEIIEKLPEDQMEEIVLAVISSRAVQPF